MRGSRAAAEGRRTGGGGGRRGSRWLTEMQVPVAGLAPEGCGAVSAVSANSTGLGAWWGASAWGAHIVEADLHEGVGRGLDRVLIAVVEDRVVVPCRSGNGPVSLWLSRNRRPGAAGRA